MLVVILSLAVSAKAHTQEEGRLDDPSTEAISHSMRETKTETEPNILKPARPHEKTSDQGGDAPPWPLREVQSDLQSDRHDRQSDERPALRGTNLLARANNDNHHQPALAPPPRPPARRHEQFDAMRAVFHERHHTLAHDAPRAFSTAGPPHRREVEQRRGRPIAGEYHLNKHGMTPYDEDGGVFGSITTTGPPSREVGHFRRPAGPPPDHAEQRGRAPPPRAGAFRSAVERTMTRRIEGDARIARHAPPAFFDRPSPAGDRDPSTASPLALVRAVASVAAAASRAAFAEGAGTPTQRTRPAAEAETAAAEGGAPTRRTRQPTTAEAETTSAVGPAPSVGPRDTGLVVLGLPRSMAREATGAASARWRSAKGALILGSAIPTTEIGTLDEGNAPAAAGAGQRDELPELGRDAEEEHAVERREEEKEEETDLEEAEGVERRNHAQASRHVASPDGAATDGGAAPPAPATMRRARPALAAAPRVGGEARRGKFEAPPVRRGRDGGLRGMRATEWVQ